MKPFALLLTLLFALSATAQEAEGKERFTLSGYTKFLGSFSHTNPDFLPPALQSQFPASAEDYQIHNRFDGRYYINDAFTLGAGMRNRLFWGYQVRQGEPFFRSLDRDRGLVDMSFLYWESEAAVLHTIFDRAWAQWENKKWIVRLGRQRVNWGVNTVWNPNDIFNQYNYFDFDYEERPGADALRVQYFPDFNNTLELAFAPAEELDQSIAAVLYKTNRWQYDWQFLAGYYQKDAALGLGWAGSVGNAGFKGELTYYQPLSNATENALVGSLSGDYSFSRGTYVQLSYLYNGSSGPDANLLDFNRLASGQVQSPKNIFIFEHTAFASVNFNITPLFSGSFATMVTPDLGNLIAYPSLTYSLDDNLDLLAAVQFFASRNPLRQDRFDWLTAVGFVRLKWSF